MGGPAGPESPTGPPGPGGGTASPPACSSALLHIRGTNRGAYQSSQLQEQSTHIKQTEEESTQLRGAPFLQTTVSAVMWSEAPSSRTGRSGAGAGHTAFSVFLLPPEAELTSSVANLGRTRPGYFTSRSEWPDQGFASY